MASSLFQNQRNPQANLLNAIQLIKGDPQGLINSLMQNPQFVQFYETNKNKTAEQLLSEYGLDRNVLNMLR